MCSHLHHWLVQRKISTDIILFLDISAKRLLAFLMDGLISFNELVLSLSNHQLPRASLKATIPGKSGLSAPYNLMLFHCLMHLY